MDFVLGSVDVEASAKTGRAAYEPGLLAEANDGVLFIDDVNLVDEHTLTMMLSSLDAGVVRVEREGLSAERPCRAIGEFYARGGRRARARVGSIRDDLFDGRRANGRRSDAY